MNTRRTLLAAAGAVPFAMSLGLAGCTSPVSFQAVQGYVADADALLDRLVPLVSALDPAVATQLAGIQKEADAAAAAFAALTAPTGAKATAQLVLTLIGDTFTVIKSIPAIPPEIVAAIGAAQILLVTLASFFGITTGARTAVALAHPNAATRLWSAALTKYQAAPDKAKLAASADAQVRAFVAAH